MSEEKTPKPLFIKAEEDRIREIVIEALREYFETKSRSMKALLITVATIVGAVTVITGGLKAMLAWLGFSYIGGK